jgi:hypothetical protein
MMTNVGSSGKVVIQSMVLWVGKVKPAPTIINLINQQLTTQMAKYPLRRVEIKTFTIPSDTKSKITDHLFQEHMPKLIVLRFVENAAFNGNAGKPPFHFQNQQVKELEISINGELIETRPLEPNFNEDQYLRLYLILYKGLGK